MRHEKTFERFAPFLWSYDMGRIDPLLHKKTVIVQVINYGDLRDWRALAEFYGETALGEVLTRMPATELRPRVRRLVELLFHIPQLNYAPRGAR